MVCILPVCRKISRLLTCWPVRGLSRGLLLGLILLMAACSQSTPEVANGHLAVRNLTLGWQQYLHVQAGLELGLSNANIEALQSGVPLTFSVDFRLGRRYQGWARELRTESFHWRIRYLPLSEHYALENPITNTTETYPRLRTLLTALRLPSWYPTQVENVAIGDNDYQMQIRARLNRLQLPAPLRLPAMFSSQWRLRDSWHTLLIPAPEIETSQSGLAPS